MTAQNLRKIACMALLIGGLFGGITVAVAPVASADKSDELFRCTDAGGTMKDCCAKGGGDYNKHPNGAEVCTFDETKKAVLRDPGGQMHLVDGNNKPLPTRATTAPGPGGQTQLGP